jgi:diguanylate cyclase (GGDEF)-like protein/PAS domain S-box-containing protein
MVKSNFSPDLFKAIEKLKPHDHLCLIYENQEEQFNAVIPFIKMGLERHEKCIYIVDDNTFETVKHEMKAQGINVDDTIESKELSIIDKQDSYLKQGKFDPDWMIQFLNETTKAALAEGFSALRVTGEMTWALGSDPGNENLFDYESKLNEFFPKNKSLAICQYNRNRFSPEIILNVIRTHPFVIYGGDIYTNYFFIPPNLFNSKNQPDQEVNQLLQGLQTLKKRETDLISLEQRSSNKEEALNKEHHEKIKAQEFLEASEKRYHDLFNNIASGVAVYEAVDDGSDFIFRDFNAAAERIENKPRASVIGRKVTEVFPGIHEMTLLETFRKVWKTGKSELNPATIYKDKQLSSWRESFVYKLDSGEIVAVYEDITERKRTEEEILANNGRMQALTEILQHQSETTQDLLAYALDQALYLTKSKLGYIYFYDEEKREFTLNTWSREVMQACSVQDPQTVYQLDKTGAWGEAVRQRKPLVMNDFQASHPLKKGYPEGHAPLNKFMTVPIFKNEKIVAVVGMANKPDDYTDMDVLQLTLLMGSVWNIVELRMVEEALSDSESELQALFASMKDLVIIYNNEGRYLKIASGDPESFYKPSLERIGKTVHEIFPKEVADLFVRHIKTVLETQRSMPIEYYLEIDDVVVWFNASVSPLKEDTVLWVARDITDRKLAEEESRLIGTHDILTSLYNRTFYEEELSRLEKSRHYPVSIFMIDVDDLKTTNDTQGHAAGDQLLQRAAQVLLLSFRAEDVVARIGGDEFAIILPTTNEAAARSALKRINHFLELNNKSQDHNDLKISIGVATCNAQGTLSETVKQADDRMYQDKQSKG